MFYILGWIIVIWLIGSTILSTQFHLKSYLSQKTRIRSGEVGESYQYLHKQHNWKLLVFIQLVKLTIALFVLILLFQ